MTVHPDQPEPIGPVPQQYQVSFERPRTNHILHLMLSLLTFGFWVPVWIVLTIVHQVASPARRVTAVYGANGMVDRGQVPELPTTPKQMIGRQAAPIRRFKPATVYTVAGILGLLLLSAALQQMWGSVAFFVVLIAGWMSLCRYLDRRVATQQQD